MLVFISMAALAVGGQVSDAVRKEFLEAVSSGKAAEVRSSLSRHPELKNARTRTGASAVQFAFYNGQPQIAKIILAAKPAMDLPTAVTAGLEKEAAALLKKRPQSVNEMSKDGFTPLGLAVAFGRHTLTRLLIKHGADVHKRSRALGKVAPIHSAVFGRNIECVRILLEHKADVNATQTDRFTPLHEAAQNGDLEIAKLLLSFGAKKDLRTGEGKTAHDVALDANHAEMAAFLAEP